MFKNIRRTKIAKDYSCFLKLWWRNKSFSPVFRSSRSPFSSLEFPASENNPSEYTRDDCSTRYFLSKFARYRYFVLFKFHQFKTLSSSVSAFKFSVAKKPFISTSMYFLRFLWNVSSEINHRLSLVHLDALRIRFHIWSLLSSYKCFIDISNLNNQ